MQIKIFYKIYLTFLCGKVSINFNKILKLVPKYNIQTEKINVELVLENKSQQRSSLWLSHWER